MHAQQSVESETPVTSTQNHTYITVCTRRDSTWAMGWAVDSGVMNMASTNVQSAYLVEQDIYYDKGWASHKSDKKGKHVGGMLSGQRLH